MVDSGDLLAPKTRMQAGERAQRRVKAELLMDAYGRGQIDGMAVGVGEFAFGRQFLEENAQQFRLPYLAANLVDAESLEPLFEASRIVTVGDMSVGLLGLASPRIKDDTVRILDHTDAARKSVAELRAQAVDFVVVLANLTFDENEALAAAVDGIDIIVAGSSRRMLHAPGQVANTLIVEVGNRGKYLGVLKAGLKEGGQGWKNVGRADGQNDRIKRFEQRITMLNKRMEEASTDRDKARVERQLTFYRDQIAKNTTPEPTSSLANTFVSEQVALSRNVKDHGPTAELVQTYLERMNRLELGADGASSQSGGLSPGRDDDGIPSVSGVKTQKVYGDFVGAQACAECHRSQYRQWKASPHARAYAALIEDSRHLDYQCFSCHVTGFGKRGGPKEPKNVGMMRDVQCEACHSAGRKHLANPEENRLSARVPETVCVNCHTPERTEGRFDYASYLPKVVHGTASPGTSSQSQ